MKANTASDDQTKTNSLRNAPIRAALKAFQERHDLTDLGLALVLGTDSGAIEEFDKYGHPRTVTYYDDLGIVVEKTGGNYAVLNRILEEVTGGSGSFVVSPSTAFWDQHERFLHTDWKTEVMDDNTRIGYWEWIISQARSAAHDAEAGL